MILRSSLLSLIYLCASAALPAVRAAAQDSVLARPLTLGDAARLGARQSAAAIEARARTDQANARITQSRSDLLPSVSGYVQEAGRTYN
ncbi:MAG: hypothetical protein ACHQRL_04055, partial [Gemmatimonadales bacterium]